MLSWLKRLRTRNDAPPPPAPTPTPAASTPEAATPTTVAMVSPPVVANGSIGSAPPVDIPRDKIAARAFEIWVRKGKPQGQDFKNWVEAEAELRAEFAAHSDHEPLPRKSR